MNAVLPVQQQIEAAPRRAVGATLKELMASNKIGVATISHLGA